MPANRSDRVVLPGSDRAPVAGAQRVGNADPDQPVSITLVLRPRSGDAPAAGDHQLSAAELVASRGADPADIDRVRSFVAAHGLRVESVNTAARSMSITGTAAQMAEAFQVDLGRYVHGQASYRGRTGPVYVPAELADVIKAVLGLDDRPQARAHFRIQPQPDGGAGGQAIQAHAAPASFTPAQLGQLYDFPKLDGAGQTVAIIELGGGYKSADLTAYFAALGLPRPRVSAVSVDGARNKPAGDPNSADGEVLLDIEVVGALAPKAKIAVYFAPNTTKGFYDGLAAAIHDARRRPSALSISWGMAETGWTAQAMDAYDALFADAAALGITVTAAAGDDGSSDSVNDGKAHVDFPASSPHVLACGGTRVTATGSSIQSETVWNNGAGGGATGGGVSAHFPRPAYQSGVTVPARPGGHGTGRGVPDVAGDADPQTGYRIRVDGHDLVFGGTSAVAPLWAALVALANQHKQQGRVGFLQTKLYGPAGSKGLRDVTSGNNGAYSASIGWDACTGLGTPIGQPLIDALIAD